MYRDDLQAALEKVRVLESENGRLKDEVERLRPRDPAERPIKETLKQIYFPDVTKKVLLKIAWWMGWILVTSGTLHYAVKWLQ